MDSLYYLALFQGVLFCYRFMLGSARKWVAKHVAAGKCNESEVEIVSNYLCETKIGCEKDPSFAKGRNLITDAIEKIGSNSPFDCVYGVKMLCTAICIGRRRLECLTVGSGDYHKQQDILNGQWMLMRYLVLSASSSKQILQKLLETLDLKGPHDRETRKHAAVIVEHLAFNINLEEYPQGIQYISSLIETFGQYCIAEPFQRENDQYWYRNAPLPTDDYAKAELGKAYKELLLQGLLILRNLATDENNCKVMSNTRDLVSKIMAPVTSDLLDHTANDHGAWSDIVERSMEVVIKLTGAPGETGAKLHSQISSCEKTVRTLWRILRCNKCNEGLQQKAIQILTRLYMDTNESNIPTDFVLKNEGNNKEDFVRMLVDIFMSDKSTSIRGYAGVALSEICFHGGIGDATIVIQKSADKVVDSFAEVLVHDKNETCRQAAAEILEHLCAHYTKDDEFLGKLRKAILEVIGEIFRSGDETHKGKDRFAKQKTDIESQSDGTQENNKLDKEEKGFQPIAQSIRSTNLLSSLLSLCGTVYDTTLISDLVPLHAPSFLGKLKEVVVKKINHSTIENLLMCKVISKMIISVMEHNGARIIEREDLESLIKALSIASENMFDVDYSMVFRSANETTSKLDGCTLVSLMKEAKELHAMMPSTSMGG